MSTQTSKIAADHKITIEFLGTDLENEPGYQMIYGISCSCGTLPSTEAHSARQADRRIANHLKDVGITESHTQR